jgi:hypothetical protein
VRSSVSAAFDHAADALERSAELADQHAHRKAAQGQSDVAAAKRERAKRARFDAERARAFAHRLAQESPDGITTHPRGPPPR